MGRGCYDTSIVSGLSNRSYLLPLYRHQKPSSYHQHGALFSVRELKRLKIKVPAPGGNDWSYEADAHAGVDDHVHLSFCDEHPMEFEARKRGDIIQSRLLKVSPKVLDISGILVTLGVANKSGVVQMPFDTACGHLDYEVMYQYTNWRDPDVHDRLQKARKCELLVPKHVPLELIKGL